MEIIMGHLVSVLSLLVTVLIGWQIGQIINIERIKINFKNDIRNFNEEIKGKLDILTKLEKNVSNKGNAIAQGIILNLKEVKDFEKDLKKVKRKIFPDVESPTEELDSYYIAIYENAHTHKAIFNRYKINIVTNEIFRLNIVSGEYEPIKEE